MTRHENEYKKNHYFTHLLFTTFVYIFFYFLVFIIIIYFSSSLFFVSSCDDIYSRCCGRGAQVDPYYSRRLLEINYKFFKALCLYFQCVIAAPRRLNFIVLNKVMRVLRLASTKLKS